MITKENIKNIVNNAFDELKDKEEISKYYTKYYTINEYKVRDDIILSAYTSISKYEDDNGNFYYGLCNHAETNYEEIINESNEIFTKDAKKSSLTKAIEELTKTYSDDNLRKMFKKTFGAYPEDELEFTIKNPDGFPAFSNNKAKNKKNTSNTVQILFTCPNCGNTTWIMRKDAKHRSIFECAACEELALTEDMGIQTSDGISLT